MVNHALLTIMASTEHEAKSRKQNNDKIHESLLLLQLTAAQ